MAETDEVKDMSGIEVMNGIVTGMKKGVRKENEPAIALLLDSGLPGPSGSRRKSTTESPIDIP